MFRSILKAAVCGAAFMVLSVGSARADFSSGLIDMDFGANSGTQVGPAVIGSAGDTWNEASFSNTTVSLLASTGAASGVNLTLNNYNGTILFIANAPFNGTPYQLLMNDSLNANPGSAASLTLTGLTPNLPYELYFYSQASPVFPPSVQTYVINGHSRSINYDGTTGTFVEGTTYTHFASEAADATGQLIINTSSPSNGAIAGFQLVALPEPASLALFGLGCLTMRRRSRAA